MVNTLLKTHCGKSTLSLLLPIWAEALNRGHAYAEIIVDAEHDSGREAHAVLCAMLTVPAQTAEDMAIKAFLALYYELGADVADPFGINWRRSVMKDTALHRAVVADAVQLSPALAGIIASGALSNARQGLHEVDVVLPEHHWQLDASGGR